jgi:hypothetical protein
MPATFSEKRVEEIWRDYLPGRTDLVTEENVPLEIIYPGRKNNEPGADWCDAVINTGKELLRGDVEMHVNSSNWQEHGHQADPNYNRVILHVVYRHDTKSGIILQNGCKIPTLALEKYVDTPSGGKIAAFYAGVIPPLPRCRLVHQSNPMVTGEILDTAGQQRFAAKTGLFHEDITREGPGQALYRGIMAALGYSRNKDPMAALACLVPLPELETIIHQGITDTECLAYLQARLLGVAGLLPSQRGMGQAGSGPNSRVDKLEKIWAASGEKAQMSAGDWHFFKVRPGNYPVRRIAAMSYLLLRYRKTGLPAGLMDKVREVKENPDLQKLETSVFIAAGEYRDEYLDFGLKAGENNTALLGQERAADIVINVLLPFAAAIGRINGSPEEETRAHEIYSYYPAAAENMVAKDMRQKLGINRNTVKTAQKQQGLIHIYKFFCLPEKCGDCPVFPTAGIRVNN